MRTVELSEDEFSGLIFAMGLLAGQLFDDKPRFYRVLQLTNALNRNNPNWTPYEIPEGAAGPLGGVTVRHEKTSSTA